MNEGYAVVWLLILAFVIVFGYAARGKGSK